MKDIIDFYEKPSGLDYAKRRQPGQFYWAPFMYVPAAAHVARYRPRQPIEALDVTMFDPEQEQPDPSADTDTDEFLAIAKFKLRRVVVLSGRVEPWEAYGKKAGDLYLVAPIYTLWDRYMERYKYPEDFIRQAIEYRYNSVFYLPQSERHGVEEAIVRLDQTGAIHSSWLVKAPATKLSGEALELLRNWFYYYLTGMLPKALKGELDAFRDLLAEQARELE